MFVNLPGVRAGGGGGDHWEADLVCEECSQAKNSLHCIDASIQVDLSDGEEEDNAMGRKVGEADGGKKTSMPMYSREDIREQYCINDKELQVLDSRRRKGLLGCFSDNSQAGISPCSRHGKKSILTSCIARSGSDEELSQGQRPTSPSKQSQTWTGQDNHNHRPDGKFDDKNGSQEGGFDEQYFRRRPKSFCMEPAASLGRLYNGHGGQTAEPQMESSLQRFLPGSQMNVTEEQYVRSMTLGQSSIYNTRGPQMMMKFPGYNPYARNTSGMPSQNAQLTDQNHYSSGELLSNQNTQPNTPDLLLHRKAVNDSEVSLDERKTKHVSFDSSSILRSQTVGNMTEADIQGQDSKKQIQGTPSKSSERLLDGKKAPDYALYSELFTPELARQIVLERLKRSSMRTQATQTDVKKREQLQQFQQLQQQLAASPRSYRKSCMVSESVQTNGSSSPKPNQPMWHSSRGSQPYMAQTLPRGAPSGQYHVQVYNLDSPNVSSSPKYFNPESTSTPLPNAKSDQHFYKIQNHQLEVQQQKSEAFQGTPYSNIDQHPATYNRPREPVYCQSSSSMTCTTQDTVVTKMTANSGKKEKSHRSLSSDNILGDSESGYGSGNQVTYGSRGKATAVEFNSAADTPPLENKRNRLRKSVSSEGLLSRMSPKFQDNGEMDQISVKSNTFCENKSRGEIIDLDIDPLESEMPELTPVLRTKNNSSNKQQNLNPNVIGIVDKNCDIVSSIKQNILEPDVPAQDMDNFPLGKDDTNSIQENSFSEESKSTNGDGNISMGISNGNQSVHPILCPIDTSASSISAIDDSSSDSIAANRTISRSLSNESKINMFTQLGVTQPDSPKNVGGEEKHYQHNCTSTLERTTTESSPSSVEQSTPAITANNVDGVHNVPDCAEVGKPVLLFAKSSELPSIQKPTFCTKAEQICRSDSGSCDSGKTNETSMSDEYFTPIEHSIKSNKESFVSGSKSSTEKNENDLPADCVKYISVSPPVPFVSDQSSNNIVEKSIYANHSIPDGNEKSKGSDIQKNTRKLSVDDKSVIITAEVPIHSLIPVWSQFENLKSPTSETSSSSGSYSVTTDSEANILGAPIYPEIPEAQKSTTVLYSDQKTDLIETQKSMTELGREDNFTVNVFSGDCNSFNVKEENIPKQNSIHQSDKFVLIQNNHHAEFTTEENSSAEWSESEKYQRKQCMKLSLPQDSIISNGESVLEDSCDAFENDRVEEDYNEKLVEEESDTNLTNDVYESNNTYVVSNFDKNHHLISSKDSFIQSPGLARSPAMHEGFNIKDWKVERTPINTPDGPAFGLIDCKPKTDLTDSEDDEESISLASETDPISKGSATSSFLPSSVTELSDSHTSSVLQEYDHKVHHVINFVEHKNELNLEQHSHRDSLEKDVILSTEVLVSPVQSAIDQETALAALVKPPAGFTDSPVKSCKGILDSIEKINEQGNASLHKNQLFIIDTDMTVTNNHEEKPVVPEISKSQEIQDLEPNNSVDEYPNDIIPEEENHLVNKSSEPSTPHSYRHPAIFSIPQPDWTEVATEGEKDDRTRKISSSTGTGSRSSSRSRHTSGRSRTRSKSSDRILLNECHKQSDVDHGIYVGEYQRQSWVFVGEIYSIESGMSDNSVHCSGNTNLPLQRSASIESTQSEKEFSKKYQAITHRMVHRKSSAIMYSRILERTFECNKTVTVHRVDGEFGFRIHGSRPVVVSAIEPGTPAQSSGLTVGDILLTINGVNVLDLPHTQVVRVAQKCTDALELGVARTDDETGGGRSAVSIWDQLSLSKEVLAQGSLWKRKRSLGPGQQWAKRWFVLRADDCLYSFKSEEELRPSGALMLPGCIVSQGKTTDRENTLEIARPDGTSLVLSADCHDDWMEWQDLINIAASRRRSEFDIWLEVARHRSKMSAFSHQNPDCRGFLHQFEGQESCNSQWTRNMLVLLDGCLYIYQDQEQEAAAKGVIFLHGYKPQSGCSVGGKRHSFEMIPTDNNLKHFYFHAQTETEKKRWLAAMEYSIDRWMRLS